MASGLGRGHDFRCIIDEWGRLDESIGKMGDPEKDIQFDNLVEIDRKFTIPRAVYSVRLVGAAQLMMSPEIFRELIKPYCVQVGEVSKENALH